MADLAVLTRLAAAVESKSGKLVLLADPSVMGSMDAGHAVRIVHFLVNGDPAGGDSPPTPIRPAGI